MSEDIATQTQRTRNGSPYLRVCVANLTPIGRALGTVALGLIGLALALGWLSGGRGLIARADPTGAVSGVVVDANGPIGGAHVRVRATDNLTFTADDGRFTLGAVPEGQEIEVTAWADGYYIAYTHVTPTVSGVTLTLRPYHTTDHPEYEWTSPISGTSAGACGNCHPMIVAQWITNSHGSAASNPRFFSLYNGTDLSGTLPISPGYLIDFPGTAGNCANCHAPGTGLDGYLTTNMNAARGVITATIHCDYCHKIGGVYLNPATQSVYPNTPGAQSTRMLRPPPGDNIFFGPYDDIHEPDTYLPVMSESAYCAPCHQFSFWGTSIYASYEEWLNSPYADLGVTCQKCHMPPNGDTFFALPDAGGLEHPPDRIPSHLDLGATSVALLQNSVTLTAMARQIADRIEVTVLITNTDAGHHVPTDHPGRHMILAVRATDVQAHDLAQVSGSVVPGWGGAQSGQPGKVFAKVLQDIATGEAPVVSYWKQTRILSDTRLAAMHSDISIYTFAAPGAGTPISVTVELRFRRAPQALIDGRGWMTPDIIMEQTELVLNAAPWWRFYLPVLLRD